MKYGKKKVYAEPKKAKGAPKKGPTVIPVTVKRKAK